VDILAEDFRAELKQVIDLDTIFPQRHVFIGQHSFNVVHQGDVVADEQYTLDFRIVFQQKGGLVNQDQGLAAAGRPGDDPVAAVVFPGQHLLVVVQAFESGDTLWIRKLGISLGQLDFNSGEYELFQVVQFLPGHFELETRWEHLGQGLKEAVAGWVTADIRFRVHVIPEKDFFGAQHPIKFLTCILVLVNIGEKYTVLKGKHRIPMKGRIL